MAMIYFCIICIYLKINRAHIIRVPFLLLYSGSDVDEPDDILVEPGDIRHDPYSSNIFVRSSSQNPQDNTGLHRCSR